VNDTNVSKIQVFNGEIRMNPNGANPNSHIIIDTSFSTLPSINIFNDDDSFGLIYCSSGNNGTEGSFTLSSSKHLPNYNNALFRFRDYRTGSFITRSYIDISGAYSSASDQNMKENIKIMDDCEHDDIVYK